MNDSQLRKAAILVAYPHFVTSFAISAKMSDADIANDLGRDLLGENV